LQPVTSWQLRRSSGRGTALQSTSSPLGQRTLRSEMPLPQRLLQPPHAPNCQLHCDVERQLRTALGAVVGSQASAPQRSVRVCSPSPQVALQGVQVPVHQAQLAVL